MKKGKLVSIIAGAVFALSSSVFLPNCFAATTKPINKLIEPTHIENYGFVYPKITHNMPLGQAIEILNNLSKPSRNIYVLWEDLEKNTGINKNTPVEIAPAQEAPINKQLEILLKSVSMKNKGELSYEREGKTFFVATKNLLKNEKMAQAYALADLKSEPIIHKGRKGFGGSGFSGGGSTSVRTYQSYSGGVFRRTTIIKKTIVVPIEPFPSSSISSDGSRRSIKRPTPRYMSGQDLLNLLQSIPTRPK